MNHRESRFLEFLLLLGVVVLAVLLVAVWRTLQRRRANPGLSISVFQDFKYLLCRIFK